MLILAGVLGSPVRGWLSTLIVGWEHVTVTCGESTASSLKDGKRAGKGRAGRERGDREGYSKQKKRAEGQSSSATSTVCPENSTVS